MELVLPVLARIQNVAIRRQTLMDTFMTLPGEDAIAEFRSERLKKTVKMLTSKETVRVPTAAVKKRAAAKRQAANREARAVAKARARAKRI